MFWSHLLRGFFLRSKRRDVKVCVGEGRFVGPCSIYYRRDMVEYEEGLSLADLHTSVTGNIVKRKLDLGERASPLWLREGTHNPLC